MADGYKVLARMTDVAASAVSDAANSDLANAAARPVYKVLRRMSDLPSDVVNAGSSAVDSIQKSATDAANSVASTAVDVSSSVKSGLDKTINTVTDTAKSIGNTVADTVDPVVNAAKEAGSYIADKTSEYWSKVPDTGEVTARSAAVLGGVIAPILPVNASAFAKFMSGGGKLSITQEDFSPSDLITLKDVAKGVIARGDNKITYEDWGYNEDNVLKQENIVAGSIMNPKFRMASLIGQTAPGNVYVNKDGDLIVKDVYDFNSGPRGAKLSKALLHKEAGDRVGYERLLKEATDGLTYFGKIRVWASALGAPEGKGSSWEINLGKYEETPTKSADDTTDTLLQSGP